MLLFVRACSVLCWSSVFFFNTEKVHAPTLRVTSAGALDRPPLSLLFGLGLSPGCILVLVHPITIKLRIS